MREVVRLTVAAQYGATWSLLHPAHQKLVPEKPLRPLPGRPAGDAALAAGLRRVRRQAVRADRRTSDPAAHVDGRQAEARRCEPRRARARRGDGSRRLDRQALGVDPPGRQHPGVPRRQVPVVSDAREVMSWDDLGAGCRELAEAIHADGWTPDLVLGISRGGLLVAGALAYALGVKNTATISVEFYTGVDERLELPMLLPPGPRSRRPLGGARPDRRRRRRHGGDARARPRLLRRPGGRGARRGAVREVALDDRERVRVAANRPLDHVPVERDPPVGGGRPSSGKPLS